MGKYLHLGTGPGGDRWTLPEKTDVAKLRKQLAQAMTDGKAMTVAVEVGRGQTAELVVNGGAIPAALAWEDAPSGGGITIID